MPTPDPIADSVRLAWPEEAAAVTDLQRRVWSAHLPVDLASTLLGGVDRAQMTEAWRAAIERPPQARYRVLVAVEQERVVGFATTLPSQDDDAEAGVDGEIDQLAVDPAAQHRGHGSRLLNACADTLRADGFRRGRTWVGADDEARRFLRAAGWVEDGATRTLGFAEDVAGRLAQVRLHTDLAEV